MSAQPNGVDTSTVVHAPQLRTFEIIGTFEAEDILDAFRRLGTHFFDLYMGDHDAPERLGQCNLEVRPAP